MECQDCRAEMRVRRTYPSGTDKIPTISRVHDCACGARFLSEESITRRLTPVAISSPSVARGQPPDRTPNGHRTDVNGLPNVGNQDVCDLKGGLGVSVSNQIRSDLPLFPVTSEPSGGDQGSDRPRARRRKDRKETPAFMAFYAVYPRKVARDAAWRAWQSMGLEAIASAAMEAIAWQTEHVFKLAPIEKVPHPATWINAGRWKDERPSHSNGHANVVSSPYPKMKDLPAGVPPPPRPRP